MRSSLTVAIILYTAVAAGCGAADTRTCRLALSWGSPAYACEGAAPQPEPPPPEPEPPPPEPPPERVKVSEEKLEIGEKVQFETDSATLLPESENLLNEVAKVINDHPEITKIQVEGHTDGQASDKYNMKLSRERANAVKDYLVKQGVDEKRLSAKGFGESQPIADNETEEGRYQNRRVEFKIMKREGGGGDEGGGGGGGGGGG
jgi:outer membrane protein OmpA-like peptidoglycan-associated protein